MTGTTSTTRVDSLDVFRGAAIAGMLLVNNPGSWSHIYDPLEHAAWNGWTFTDLIFPFFLFIVGVAMMYSFPKRLARGASRKQLFAHVARRSGALVILGWWGASWSPVLWPGGDAVFSLPEPPPAAAMAAVALRVAYPVVVLSAVVLLAGTSRTRAWARLLVAGLALFIGSALVLGFVDPLVSAIAGIRIPGVLVRIGVCYFLASGIYFLTPTPRALATWIVVLLAVYAVWMMLVPVPGFGMPDLDRGFPTADTPPGELFSNWAFFVDYQVLGEHTWSVRQLRGPDGALIWSFDPEGILSTVPATCTVLFGMLTGLWMRRTDRSEAEKLSGLFVAGCWLLAGGIAVGIWMPVNKRLWTSSYTVFTAGMALLWLGVAYHAIDLRGHRRGLVTPLRSYGKNAIFAFVASGMMAVALGRITVSSGTADVNGEVARISLKSRIWEILSGLPVDERTASLLFAVGFVAFWAWIVWVMDRRGVYFKV